MKLNQILIELEALSDDKIIKHYIKRGAHENLYGVKLGDIRKLSKKIKLNHSLAFELWKTGNIDARLLAILTFKVEEITLEELDQIVKETKFDRVADWVNSYLVKKHPNNEDLRVDWMNDDNPMAARAGWNLTSNRVVKNPEILDISLLLDRLENEMGSANPLVQWTMNFVLAEIGVNFSDHRNRALSIGEKLGVYRDYPTSKGCISPFAPIWITELVKRQTK